MGSCPSVRVRSYASWSQKALKKWKDGGVRRKIKRARRDGLMFPSHAREAEKSGGEPATCVGISATSGIGWDTSRSRLFRFQVLTHLQAAPLRFQLK